MHDLRDWHEEYMWNVLQDWHDGYMWYVLHDMVYMNEKKDRCGVLYTNVKDE